MSRKYLLIPLFMLLLFSLLSCSNNLNTFDYNDKILAGKEGKFGIHPSVLKVNYKSNLTIYVWGNKNELESPMEIYAYKGNIKELVVPPEKVHFQDNNDGPIIISEQEVKPTDTGVWELVIFFNDKEYAKTEIRVEK